MAYEVIFTPRTRRTFLHLPTTIARKIAQALQTLADNPRSHLSIKLSGGEGYRSGNHDPFHSLDLLLQSIQTGLHRGSPVLACYQEAAQQGLIWHTGLPSSLSQASEAARIDIDCDSYSLLPRKCSPQLGRARLIHLQAFELWFSHRTTSETFAIRLIQ